MEFLRFIDKTIPTIKLCTIESICCLGYSCIEITYGVLAIVFRVVHIIAFGLVNYSSVFDYVDDADDQPVARTSFEIPSETDCLLMHYKLASVVAEDISRLFSSFVLIAGVIKKSELLLRVFIKLTLICMVFIVNDIVFLLANSIIHEDAVVIVTPIVSILVRMPMYFLIMAIVDSHWRLLEETRPRTKDVKSVLISAMSEMNYTTRFTYPSLDGIKNLSGAEEKEQTNYVKGSSPTQGSYSIAELFRGLAPRGRHASVATSERSIFHGKSSPGTSSGGKTPPDSVTLDSASLRSSPHRVNFGQTNDNENKEK